MMHTADTLYAELRASLSSVDRLIAEAKTRIKSWCPSIEEAEDDYISAVDPQGKPVLLPLLVTRSEILIAMANLKAASMNEKAAMKRR